MCFQGSISGDGWVVDGTRLGAARGVEVIESREERSRIARTCGARR